MLLLLANPIGIHFGIVTSVFRRHNDPEFHLPMSHCVNSVLKQTFKNWTLIVIGDGMDESDFHKVKNKLKAILPHNKFIFKNIDKSLREENLLKGQNLFSCTIWCFAGVSAANKGLDIANNMSFITHYARLDDDDMWKPNHLETLVKGYQLNTQIGFVHTRATFSNDPNRFYPSIDANNNNNEYSFQPPIPSLLIHSTASWSLQIPQLRSLRYRQPAEQHVANRSNSSRAICCRDGLACGLIPCQPGNVMAADADMWNQINSLSLDDKLFTSVFMHEVTLVYLHQDNKTTLINKLNNNNNNNNNNGVATRRNITQ